MIKREIVSRLVAMLSERSSQVAAAAEDARQLSIAAPGRNMSRYDSSKEEFGYLADGLNTRRMELDRGQTDLEWTCLPSNPENVMSGTLVRVNEGGTCYSTYLLLPYGGGETVETDEGDIDVITPSSPLGKAMMGKKAGEMFSFEVQGAKREYQVERIE